MADAGAATVTDKAPVAPAFPIKMLIIIVIAALAAGLGGAIVVIKLLEGKKEAPAEEQKADPAKAEPRVDAGVKRTSAGAPGVMFDLEPFIVNLADTPEIRYLKLTLKLEADNEAVSAELASRMPQVRDTILVLLTSKDSTAVRTPQGKFQLRDEITQRVNGLLSRPGVRSAYFTEFVVQ